MTSPSLSLMKYGSDLARSMQSWLASIQPRKLSGSLVTAFSLVSGGGWLIASQDGLIVRVHFGLGLEDGGGDAAAVRMPARELEVLWVLAFQLIADVVERMRLAILAEAGVVVRQMHLDAHDEVQLLPPLMVGDAVGDVGLRCRQPCGR